MLLHFLKFISGKWTTKPVTLLDPLPVTLLSNAEDLEYSTSVQLGNVSVGNTTNIPLTLGSTFTGEPEHNNFPDVFVSCKTDKSGTLYFDFSNDGENWDTFPPTGFTVTANTHKPHKVLKAGRHFKIRFVNTSGENQTYLRLYCYYGKFSQLNSPLLFTPSADSDAITNKSILVGQTDGGHFKFVGTDAEGNLKVRITDNTSPFGEVITAALTPVIQADFVYGLNTNLFSTPITTGSGIASSSNQMGVVSTSASTNSSALIQTVRRAKYRAGEGILSRFTAQFTEGETGSFQLAGMRNADIDGWFVGYNGTQFGLMYRRNGVDIWIPQTDFIDKLDGTGLSGITIDPQSINIFQMGIGYLGVRGCVFQIENPISKAWTVFYDYSLIGESENQTQSTNPTMTFGIQAINTTNDTDIVVKAASIGVFIVGPRERIGSTYALSHFKSIGTTETNIITLRNNTTLNGVPNQAQIRIRSLSIATAGNVPVIYKLTKNATLGGTPNYTNLDSVNSCTSSDIAGTTLSGGNSQFNSTVSTNGSAFLDLSTFDIFLSPGDTLTISAFAISGAATNQVATINYNEDI